MKKYLWIIIIFVLLISIGVFVLTFHLSSQNEPDCIYEKETIFAELDTERILFRGDLDVDYTLNGMPLPPFLDPSGAKEMIEYNNYFAAKYGNFDVEYNELLTYETYQDIGGLYPDFYFDDSGLGIVAYVEYPGMCQAYSYVWRTTDYGKTWVINPTTADYLNLENMRVYENYLFSVSHSRVNLGSYLVYSNNCGESFDYTGPKEIVKNLEWDAPEHSYLFCDSELEIVGIDYDKKHIFLALTKLDYDDSEHTWFIGKFDFDLNLIKTIHSDKAFCDTYLSESED